MLKGRVNEVNCTIKIDPDVRVGIVKRQSDWGQSSEVEYGVGVGGLDRGEH